MQIDATARIEDGATIGPGAVIGPYCIIGRDVRIGAGCELVAHVHVEGRTSIGPRTVVHPFARLGGPPQSVAYKGEPTTLSIGSDCVIRESVTMSRGTAQGGGETVVGDGGFFMAYSHVAHDCRVGSHAIFANSATLAGHCTLGDHVFLSGLVAVHQFSRIGSGAMAAGVSAVRGDLIPYGLAAGAEARLIGINVVGMRRRQFPLADIRAARLAYRLIFLGKGPLAERIDRAEGELGHVPAVAEIIAFLRAPRKRPLCQPRARGRSTDEAAITE
ncbi:MAG: acyl-ACP--UDP-N-acetylglucosamine O-acyltransferase [Labrys sp. (in: a-proteobacteria)]